VMRIDGVCKYL